MEASGGVSHQEPGSARARRSASRRARIYGAARAATGSDRSHVDRGLLHLRLLPVPLLLADQRVAEDRRRPLQADLFPPHPTLDNYSSIFKNGDFTSALKNSVIVTTVTTVLALIVGSFAAYALARLRFKRKFLILAPILSISTFPAIAIAAPIFQLWTDIGLYDTTRPDPSVPDVRRR